MARREPCVGSIKGIFCRKYFPFCVGENVRERERGRERERSQGFLRQFTGFRWSEVVGSRTKVHHLDEGYE